MERFDSHKINNELYHSLGERWYNAKDDPIAMLRAERRLLVPWVKDSVAKYKPNAVCKILDVACGAGLFSNPLGVCGHNITGFDVSFESLKIARQYDQTKKITYLQADAYNFPFLDSSFDIVCAMDFLEHVDKPEKVISEVSRVLRPKGVFFFSTFSKNWLAWLIVIKGMEWFVKNTPPNLHVLEFFINPSKLKNILQQSKLSVKEMLGTRPCFFTKAFFQMLLSGIVEDDFTFTFSKSLLIGYSGIAVKE